jgi:hypothetical protein
LSEFFAPPAIDLNADNLLSTPYLSPESKSELHSRLEDGGSIYLSTDSYTRVFSKPPYGLTSQGRRLPHKKSQKLFYDINLALFGKERSHLVVYSWSTDWADYFDAGNRWWGSYLWTIERPDSSLMIGIAASASD